MEYGSECGCSNTPPPPCNIKCPLDGQIFNTKSKISEEFPANQDWNGWYCGEVRGAISVRKNLFCTTEMTSEVANQCCMFPSG